MDATVTKWLFTQKQEFSESAGDLVLDMEGSRTMRDEFMLLVSYPVYGA